MGTLRTLFAIAVVFAHAGVYMFVGAQNGVQLFYVISGTGEYRFGGERHAIKAGDTLGAPAGGPETAHQIINTGTAPLVYLGISTMAKTEIVEYPDSGKFLAKTNRAKTNEEGSEPSRFRHIGRPESDLDYWDGEPGA